MNTTFTTLFFTSNVETREESHAASPTKPGSKDVPCEWGSSSSGQCVIA
jgi:hypothetical protein